MDQSFDRRQIADPGQIRVLSSPVRQEIVDTLASLGGRASVAELAHQLGRPTDGLYYHVRVLVRAGLIEAVPSSEGEERVYRLCGEGDQPLRLAYRPGPQGNLAALKGFARSLLQVAGIDFENALHARGVALTGARRELWAARNKGWVSPQDLEEINVLIERLNTLASQPAAPGRERLVSFAFALAPVNPRPKRRAPRVQTRSL
jgi:DNA-binding transcriptional ArsR family regulator